MALPCGASIPEKSRSSTALKASRLSNIRTPTRAIFVKASALRVRPQHMQKSKVKTTGLEVDDASVLHRNAGLLSMEALTSSSIVALISASESISVKCLRGVSKHCVTGISPGGYPMRMKL